VDTLGVSEPVIQEYGLGDNQILVELPGIEDLDRVKSIIQSTAGWRFTPWWAARTRMSRRRWPAWAARFRRRRTGAWLGYGGTARMRTACMCCSALRWWPAATSAPPIRAPIQNTGQRMFRFTLTNEAGDKFYDYTSKNVGQSMAVVMGGRVKEVATIESAIRDSRRDYRQLQPG
jgi:preprotein translocase subunit SecD